MTQAALRRNLILSDRWSLAQGVGDETLFVLRHSAPMRESQHRRSCWLWRAPAEGAVTFPAFSDTRVSARSAEAGLRLAAELDCVDPKPGFDAWRVR
jgi:hypothetical protein